MCALSQFHGKTIIPLCFGAFGEVNEDLDKVIQCLAREAASSDEGLTISPLVNTNMQQQQPNVILSEFGIKDKVTWDIIKVITALRAKMNIFHKQFKHVHITQSKEFLSRKRNPRCY